MIHFFSRQRCSACSEAKKMLSKNKIDVIFHDADTVDGMAEAAYQGVQHFPAFIITRGESEVWRSEGRVPSLEELGANEGT